MNSSPLAWRVGSDHRSRQDASLELLNGKKELERGLETLSLNYSKCGLDVH
jgi:hypothetical protein